MDYCNSLMAGIPKYFVDRLQRIQSKAAHLICRSSRYEHLMSIIRSLFSGWQYLITQPINFPLILPFLVLVLDTSLNSPHPYYSWLLQVPIRQRHMDRGLFQSSPNNLQQISCQPSSCQFFYHQTFFFSKSVTPPFHVVETVHCVWLLVSKFIQDWSVCNFSYL